MLKGVLYYKMENAAVGFGPMFRAWGNQLFRQGLALQGPSAHEDTLVPSLRCVAISDSKFPKLLAGDWVAPNATVIGDVELGEGSSLWHGVTVRGDTAAIKIGKNSSIQDLTRLGSNKRGTNDEITIGDNVYIGANCSLDACTVEDNAFVGMGSSVARGAAVEAFGVLSAGAALAEGVTVPSGQIWVGSPAHYLRDLTQEEKHLMGEHKLELQQLSQIYCEETEKTFREQLDSIDDRIRYRRQDPQEKMIDKLGEVGMPSTHDDMEYIEHRIYHDYVGAADFQLNDPNTQANAQEKKWTPYEQDLSNYPEVFRNYQENYAAYDKVKERFENENPLEEQGPEPLEKRLPKDMSPWEQKYDDLMPRYTGTLCQ